MAKPIWDTLTIVGVGLLGGSIGLAARQRGLVRRVVGWGRRAETLREALDLGVIDEADSSLTAALSSASLVVVCTPVAAVAEYVELALRAAPDDALVTDVGSTKAGIVAEVDRRLAQPADAQRRARFVASHPLAGSERAGVRFSSPDLFANRTVVMTPSGVEAPEHLDSVETLWRSLGSRVVRQTPSAHDQAVAAISHVPHLAASALAAATPMEWLELVATGWLDTTRVAAGDVELWRQILAANRLPVLESLDRYLAALHACRDALAQGDDLELVRWLQRGKQVRDAVGN